MWHKAQGRGPRPYTDMHCHILPGIDDGAVDWDDSLRIAMYAKESGAQRIVATPHIMAGVFEPSPEEIRAKVQELQDLVDERDLGIQVLPGSEVHLSESLCEDYLAGRLVPMGRSTHVLVELPFHTLPGYATDVLFHLRLSGAGVILAHPERNDQIASDLGILESLVSSGMLVQVDAGSLVGAYGQDVKTCVEKMVKRGMFHFIGSDAHTGSAGPVTERGADIRPALRRLRRLCAGGQEGRVFREVGL